MATARLARAATSPTALPTRKLGGSLVFFVHFFVPVYAYSQSGGTSNFTLMYNKQPRLQPAGGAAAGQVPKLTLPGQARLYTSTVYAARCLAGPLYGPEFPWGVPPDLCLSLSFHSSTVCGPPPCEPDIVLPSKSSAGAHCATSGGERYCNERPSPVTSAGNCGSPVDQRR